jgi:alkanesulfonate monooxygenase SsuD/methylene tetrahydromethanopterin reductase-like flavin-dependent oxidoreductase (luciferase family)
VLVEPTGRIDDWHNNIGFPANTLGLRNGRRRRGVRWRRSVCGDRSRQLRCPGWRLIVMKIWLRYDLRSPPFGTSHRDLGRVALEQAEWADKRGFEAVQLPEHHGSPDGYNPSPFVLGAAIAGRTSKMRIHPSAVLLPLHDPVRVAEDTAVLDNISGRRVDLTIGLGYIPSEFAMFGVSLNERGRLVEEKLGVLRRALAGERFEYEGRKISVTPRPVQQPTPPLYVGGGVVAAAKRAAKLGRWIPTSQTR